MVEPMAENISKAVHATEQMCDSTYYKRRIEISYFCILAYYPVPKSRADQQLQQGNLEVDSEELEARDAPSFVHRSQLPQGQRTKRLQRELEALRQRANEEDQKGKTELQQLKAELKDTKQRLEDTEWRLCQKNGEISLLKSQIKQLQSERAIRDQDSLATLRARLDTRSSSPSPSTGTGEGSTNVSKELMELRHEVFRLRNENQTQRTQFDQQRMEWKAEREKVLRYQRQLQSNYIQFCNRNNSSTTSSSAPPTTSKNQTDDMAVPSSTPGAAPQPPAACRRSFILPSSPRERNSATFNFQEELTL
ncbi:unnamed protein product [Cyprideis torosa]|uniref:Uncharacterized protein n=1 Tax=Cyprideis torosa TaxID=163714 RepID=A0A7R8ZH10_9CRUS|nr:unnamed protein product [Cyprideis torosa]CAG0882618.1 unnamed protein product [Cyprideis torosa]